MFLTLTYSDENLPFGMSLFPRHLELFWKRLRKKYGKKIKYFAAGEYGERTARPHYHAIVFGMRFDDLDIKIVETKGFPEAIIHSPSLEKLWGLGHCSVGEVSFESAAYVARYCLKKIYGDVKKVREHYKGREPEFVRMSKGIASEWYEKNKSDVFPLDRVFARGKPCKPPRYFDKKLELENPELLARIKELRRAQSKEDSVERLNAKNEACRLKMAKKRRGF